MQRRRLGRGCCFLSTFATREEPMKASAAEFTSLARLVRHQLAVATKGADGSEAQSVQQEMRVAENEHIAEHRGG